MSTNYKLLGWVAFNDLLNIASEFYMFFHGIFGTKLCSTSLEDGFFTVVYSVDLLIVLVVYNSVGVFNTAKVIHHAGHVIQRYSVTVVHVCPQCAANKGNIINDSNFFFQQVHIWQVTEYIFQVRFCASKVTVVVLVVAHDVNHMWETLRTSLHKIVITITAVIWPHNSVRITLGYILGHKNVTRKN